MFDDMLRGMIGAASQPEPQPTDYADSVSVPPRYPIMDQASLLLLARQLDRQEGEGQAAREKTKQRAIRIAKRKEFYLPQSWRGKREAAFVMSDQMKQDAIQAALNEEPDPDCDGDADNDDPWGYRFERGYVRHVFPDGTFVFQMGWDGDWFRRSFTIDGNGEATIGADCVQVAPQLSFVPYAGVDMDAAESMATNALIALDERPAGESFDAAYLTKAKGLHEATIHMATKASTEAEDPKVRSLGKRIAAEHAPHLHEMNRLHHGIVLNDNDPDHDGDDDSKDAPGTDPDQKESLRQSGTEFHEVLISKFTEAVVGDDGQFRISGTAIGVGVNRSETRLYPKETLSAAVGGFAKKKMYINHSSRQDALNRPERSVMEIGGKIESASLNGSGGIDYTAVIIDPPLREKLALMKQADALDAIGVSVNYTGEATQVKVEGRTLDRIDSMELLSLDFVTEPGAWGTVARMESMVAEGAAEERNETVTHEELTKLVEGLAGSIGKLTEATNEDRAARRRVETKGEIRDLCVAANLPNIAQAQIVRQFAGAETLEGVAEAIQAQVDYIKELTESLAPKGGTGGTPRVKSIVVSGLGETGGKATSGASTEAQQLITPTAENFAENFGALIPGGAAVAKMVYERFAN